MQKVVPINKGEVEVKIPSEIVTMFEQAMAYEHCKDECITKVFGWKKAAYFQRKYSRTLRKAWDALYKVHPHLAGRTLTYNPDTNLVTAK